MNQLENFFLARLVNETLWGFPINEVIHILSFSMVLGCIVLFTARVFGVSQIPLRTLVRYLAPWFVTSFTVALISGLSFFMSKPEVYLNNPSFLTKVVLLLTLIALVTTFYFRYWRDPLSLAVGKTVPGGVKSISVLATLLVFSILLAGRLIPYMGYF